MNLRVEAVALLLIGTVFAACFGDDEPDRFPKLGISMKGSEPDLSNVSIALTRSPGFGAGRSPSYEVTVSGAGKGVFVGQHFVVTDGPVEFVIDGGEVARLLDALEAMDFMRLNHHCEFGNSANDSPIAKVVLSVGGRTASFKSQILSPSTAGGDEAHNRMHAQFDQLVQSIDASVGISRFTGTPEEAWERFREKWEEKRRGK